MRGKVAEADGTGIEAAGRDDGACAQDCGDRSVGGTDGTVECDLCKTNDWRHDMNRACCVIRMADELPQIKRRAFVIGAIKGKPDELVRAVKKVFGYEMVL